MTLLNLSVALAQEPAEAPPESKFVDIKFSVYVWNSNQGFTELRRELPRLPDLYFVSKGQVNKIEPRYNSMSSGYSYQGTLPVRFYATDPTLAEAPPKPIAEIEFPRNWQHLIFFLFPGSGGFNAVPAERSVTALPEGALRVYNFSSDTIRVLVGKKHEAIAPLQYHNFRPKVDEQAPVLPLMIGAYSEAKEQWIRAYASSFRVSEKHRKILMVYKPSADKDFFNVKMLTLPVEE